MEIRIPLNILYKAHQIPKLKCFSYWLALVFVQYIEAMQHLRSRGVMWHNCAVALQRRNNECDGVSNYRRLECLPNRVFRRRSKNTSKLRVTGLCDGNSPVTGEFPAQRASNAENVSIWWWRHHDLPFPDWSWRWPPANEAASSRYRSVVRWTSQPDCFPKRTLSPVAWCLHPTASSTSPLSVFMTNYSVRSISSPRPAAPSRTASFYVCHVRPRTQIFVTSYLWWSLYEMRSGS